jgi:hypothetical protein
LNGSFVLKAPENGLIALNVPLDPLRLGAFSRPAPLHISLVQTSPFTSQFIFHQAPFVVSGTAPFLYGFSSLEIDSDLFNSEITVNKVSVALDVVPETSHICCDVWVLLGPRPFNVGMPGQNREKDPFTIVPKTDVAPTQVRFVLGRKGATTSPGGKIRVSGTYDFVGHSSSGVYLDNMKDSFQRPIRTLKGLYAQVFVWARNPSIRLDVRDIALTVEGQRKAAIAPDIVIPR